MSNTPTRLVVAVTGASGSIYAVRFLRRAARLYDHVYVMLSDQAPAVFATETGRTLSTPFTAADFLQEDKASVDPIVGQASLPVEGDSPSPPSPFQGEGRGEASSSSSLPFREGPGVGSYENVTFLDSKDYFTPPASGSFRHDGMVIIPCSMGTLGRIAGGISNDLTTRSADVCLKERRKLILVARDTPLSLIHLRNMVTVTEAGAIVLPASPAFYNQPKTIDDLVDTVIARVLQNLGIPQDIQPEWSA
jgi:4-hydroxy-3-polyprenylbenzoate decarboxylase